MMKSWTVIIINFVFSFCVAVADKQCAPREYGTGNIVCVCNMTYCDTIEKVTPLSPNQFVQYSSSKSGLRFNKTIGHVVSTTSVWSSCVTMDITCNICLKSLYPPCISRTKMYSSEVKVNSRPLYIYVMLTDSAKTGAHFAVNISITYQTILGFGGAFTDAAGINMESLSLEARNNLLRSYFSTDGIEFNFGRVPVAGCDFSTHTYTYDDVPGDTNFTQYNLTLEDFFYKIPLIKEVQKMSERKIYLLAGAWTAPPWMKTNEDYSGFGFLKDEYYQTWAEYLVRFLDEYKKQGLEFWGISTGNEPINGILPVNKFNSMGWTPSSQRQWIKENFGPTLKKTHRNVKLIALDDQRFMLPWWINTLMEDEEVANYIDGIGVHWYWDTLFPPALLDRTHKNFPDKFIIGTEACVGDKPWEFDKVKLGSWPRGESYMADIMEDLNHWVTGWIDWNLALNQGGGPNWAKNFVDSPIIVNKTTNEFYKQPMFYALGHFSKFLPEGSIRIGLSPKESKGVSAIAFQTPEMAIVIILYNGYNSKMKVTITDSPTRHINLVIPKRSFHTVLYWREEYRF